MWHLFGCVKTGFICKPLLRTNLLVWITCLEIILSSTVIIHHIHIGRMDELRIVYDTFTEACQVESDFDPAPALARLNDFGICIF